MKPLADDGLSADVGRPKPVLSRRISRILIMCFVVQLILTSVVIHFVVRKNVQQTDAASTSAVGQLLKNVLAERLVHGWTNRESKLLDELGSDPRISFAVVMGGSGEQFHASIFKESDWRACQSAIQELSTHSGIVTSISGASLINSNLSVQCFPIHVDVSTVETTRGEKGRSIVIANLLMGFQNKNVNNMISGVHVSQILTITVIGALCILTVGFWIRKWLKPLNNVIRGIHHLTNGRPPSPVTVAGKSELAYLATAFNHMAGRLMTARRDLEKSNEELEQRVAFRTQELADAAERMNAMASTDPLTQIANRRSLSETLENRMRHALMSGNDLACVLIDLDGFKDVNDTLGHDVGDEILMVAADAIQSASGERDLPARMGGDEFLLLLEGRSAHEASLIASQIQADFQKVSRSILERESSALPVSMSIGVASFNDHHPETKKDILRMADEAMYTAKRNGKSRVEIFNSRLAA